ncbi:putative transposase [Constrictibacter sp. MBR-5]
MRRDGGGAARDPRGWHSRGYLPHLDSPGLVQAITFRLADSLPFLTPRPTLMSDAAHRRAVETVLDTGQGGCALRAPAAARTVEDALLHFDGVRCRLLAWAVMPNHVHVLIETLPGHPVPALVHSWKSFTAHRIRPGGGRFWQPDYWDRFIRDDGHLAAAVRYIEANPVAAGLCAAPADWPFGSARRRLISG